MIRLWYAAFAILVFLSGCNRSQNSIESGTIKQVTSIEMVNSLRDNSGSRLIAFDFYADWCGPCRMLAPVIETISQEAGSRISFYRINIDNVPQAAQLFKVDRIPYVVFIKNREVIAALAGIQPKEKYLSIIFANSVDSSQQAAPPDSAAVRH